MVPTSKASWYALIVTVDAVLEEWLSGHPGPVPVGIAANFLAASWTRETFADVAERLKDRPLQPFAATALNRVLNS
jgi:hypothetical protein